MAVPRLGLESYRHNQAVSPLVERGWVAGPNTDIFKSAQAPPVETPTTLQTPGPWDELGLEDVKVIPPHARFKTLRRTRYN